MCVFGVSDVFVLLTGNWLMTDDEEDDDNTQQVPADGDEDSVEGR